MVTSRKSSAMSKKTKTMTKKLVPSCSAKSKKTKRKTLVLQPSPPSSSKDITDEEVDNSEAESDDGMCEECEVRNADDDQEMKMCMAGL